MRSQLNIHVISPNLSGTWYLFEIILFFSVDKISVSEERDGLQKGKENTKHACQRTEIEQAGNQITQALR
jgi:hypothetical protein